MITEVCNRYNNRTVKKLNIEKKIKEKQLYVLFKRQYNDITIEMTCTWLRRGNIKRETESLIKIQHEIKP